MTGILLYLGAGAGDDLDSYLAGANARRIVLVEANPVLASALAARFSGDPRVTVIEAAVAVEARPSVLCVFNVAAMSSLKPPTGLFAIFPGLAVRREIPVETLPLRRLISELQVAPDEVNALVIDTPGMEGDLVHDLLETGQTFLFSEIILHCGRAPLFEGGVAGEEILGAFTSSGYDVELVDETDPDIPVWCVRGGRGLLEARRLKEEVAALRSSLALQTIQQEQLGESLVRAELEREALACRLAERESELSVANEVGADAQSRLLALEAALKGVEEEGEERLRALHAARDERAALRAALDAANAARAAAESGLEEARRSAEAGTALAADRIEALEGDLEVRANALSAAEAREKGLRAQLDEQVLLATRLADEARAHVAAELAAAQVAAETRYLEARQIAEAESTSLRQQIQALKQECDAGNAALFAAEERVRGLSAELEEQTALAARLAVERQAEASAAEAARATLEARLVEVCETADAKVTQLQQTVQARQSELARALAALDAAAVREKDLQAAAAAQAEDARQRAAAEGAQAAQKIAALETDLASIRSALSETEGRATETKAALDAQLADNARLTQERNAATAQAEAVRAGLEAQLAEARQRAAAEGAQAAQKISALETDLASIRSALSEAEGRATEAKAALDAQVAHNARLTQERNAATAQAEAVRAGLEAQLAEARQRAAAESAQAAQKISALEAGLAGAKSSLAAAETREKELKADAEAKAAAHTQQLAAMDGELKAAKSDNALALRLHAMREADLRDLQSRYAHLLEAKEKQEMLLRRLTQRLTVAAQYMYQIEADPTQGTFRNAIPSETREGEDAVVPRKRVGRKGKFRGALADKTAKRR
ncbi:hypothetical protein [Aquabacter spiritensis]|uniref:hypothetical protein n=1 Tax=Aquabacter spiritensis TaxID=933073 RepID=UPI0014055C47|nr:hypothetical protein [Aquabacter spiritensis]